MIFHFLATSPVETAGPRQLALEPSRREQIVTVFAASLAMTIVAAIAVLMGMA